ncbi:MAG TPA: response regulator transcription factor [Mycobacteriales bacterium]|nr:response regulator transcription factor [Mycobacteriales bacterium]
MTAEPESRESRRRVVLIDDHTAFVELLRYALDGLDDLECVGSAGSPAEAEGIVAEQAPDIAVVDLMLGDDDGLEVVRRLRAMHSDLVIVVASARSDSDTLALAAAAGANGFAPKRGAFAELLSILRTARPGKVSVASSLLPSTSTRASVRLTDRETEVLELMARGASVMDIAESLNISRNTCRTHVSSLHSKLGVRSRLEAVVKARKIGLLESP